MPTDYADDPHDMRVILPEALDWGRVAYIQVKVYQVERRMPAAEAGPIKWFPLLGVVERYCVEAVRRDDTWDRVMWTSDRAEALRMMHGLADRHGVPGKVVP